jgi:hypothetical protein
MNYQNQNLDPNTPTPVYRDWHSQRRAERLARHEARGQRHAGRPYGWVAGAILILLGGVFLLQNIGYLFLFNGWALFILIPALGMFASSWNSYKTNGRLTRGGVVSLAWGVMMTVLTMVFLFDLNLGLYWPVLLIVGGMVLLGTALLPI